MCTLQCAICNMQCVLCNVYFAVCNIQCTICNVYFAVCNIQCTICSVYFAMYNIRGVQQCSACISRWTLCNVLYWRSVRSCVCAPVKCAHVGHFCWEVVHIIQLVCSLIVVGVGWKRGWGKASVWLGNKSYFNRLSSLRFLLLQYICQLVRCNRETNFRTKRLKIQALSHVHNMQYARLLRHLSPFKGTSISMPMNNEQWCWFFTPVTLLKQVHHCAEDLGKDYGQQRYFSDGCEVQGVFLLALP